MPDPSPVPLGPFLSGRVTHADGAVTMALTGEFDMAAVPHVRTLLAGLESDDPREIVVDLTELGFIDSSGLSVLIDAHERSVGARAFVVLSGTGPTQRVLAMTGVDQLLTVVASRDALDERLSAVEGVEATG